MGLHNEIGTWHVDNIEQLVTTAQKLGYGIDLNFIRGVFTITNGRTKNKFTSINSALEFVQAREQARKDFMKL